MLKNQIYILITIIMLLVLYAANAMSEQSNLVDPANLWDQPTSVSPPQRPTEVIIGAYLMGLSRVSDPSEAFPSFEVEMFIDLSWQDKSLAFAYEGIEQMVFLEEEAEEKLSEIWSPDIEIQNEVEQRTTESIDLIILSDGTVQYEESFGAIIAANLDLRRFPFDDQTFDLEIQSFVWDEYDLILNVNEQQLGMDPDLQTPEWEVTGVEALLGKRLEIRDDQEFSTCTFRIHAKRRSGHYLLRVLMPLMFVMLLTWSAFRTIPSERISIGFLALLTVVATHTIISHSLPRLHYPTFSDILLTICYIFATVLIFESIWVRHLEEKGSVDVAKKIERWTQWMLPVGALVASGISIIILWS